MLGASLMQSAVIQRGSASPEPSRARRETGLLRPLHHDSHRLSRTTALVHRDA